MSRFLRKDFSPAFANSSSFSKNCPRCNAQLDQAFDSSSAAFCKCGYVDQSALENHRAHAEEKLIKIFAAITISLMLMYVHFANWGSYAFQIPFLKLGDMLGSLGPSGYHEIIDACTKQGKWPCVQSAYLGLYNKTADAEVIAELAKFQERARDQAGASRSYEFYYKVGGKNPAVALPYAKLLFALNDYDNALKYYNLSITQNPDKLAGQATGGILQIYIKQGRYVEARDLITSFWDSAENAKGYFNTEFDQLNATLGPKTAKVVKR